MREFNNLKFFGLVSFVFFALSVSSLQAGYYQKSVISLDDVDGERVEIYSDDLMSAAFQLQLSSRFGITADVIYRSEGNSIEVSNPLISIGDSHYRIRFYEPDVVFDPRSKDEEISDAICRVLGFEKAIEVKVFQSFVPGTQLAVLEDNLEIQYLYTIPQITSFRSYSWALSKMNCI